MTPDGLTDDISFPFDRDESPTRLLVWEKSGRWAASLRRELGEATTRPIEIRSSRMLKDELGDRPYSFVLIEAHEDNAHRVLDALVHLGEFAPLELAEDWDNVGLLVGDQARAVSRIMTCLTITPECVIEAREKSVDLIVSHHPMPFRPVKRLTTDHTVGQMLWDLARNGTAVYSPHTAFDSAEEGINQMTAQGLDLESIQPLVPREDALGSGRFGSLPTPITLGELIDKLKKFLRIDQVRYVGGSEQSIKKVATGCGSAGMFLEQAVANDCDAFITGETDFHTCLEARAQQTALILTGHYASERFAVERLADCLSEKYPNIETFASHNESDPIECG